MKHLATHLSHLSYYEARAKWNEVLYSLMVRREAIKASHSRMIRKLKVSTLH